jgi:hypothetical protein
MCISNEFADVELILDDNANGQRLKILDQRTGGFVYLDALALSGLAAGTDGDYASILDPARLEQQPSDPGEDHHPRDEHR